LQVLNFKEAKMYKLVALLLAVLGALVVTLDEAEAKLFKKVCAQPRAPLDYFDSPFPNVLCNDTRTQLS
jgi:hypothetical protein